MSCFLLKASSAPYIYISSWKSLQTLHKTLHSLCISLILRTLYCVGFEPKILHKTYMEPYMGTKSQRDEETKRGSLPQPLPKGKGFVAALMHRTWGLLGRLRDKETKSQKVKESKRQREEEWERGRLRKTRGRERKTRGRQRKIWGRERKIWGRERKIWGREIFLPGALLILLRCAPSFS